MPICNDTPYIHVFSILLFQSFMFGRRIGLDLSILFPPIILHSFTAETALPLFLTKHVDLAECNSIVITCSPCIPLSSPRRCHLHSKRAVHTKPTRSSAKFWRLCFTQEGTRQQRQPLLQQLQQAGCECEIERAACLLELEDAFPQEVEGSWTEKDLGWERKSFDPPEPRICPICPRIGRVEAVPNTSGVYVHANTCAKLIVRQKN
jgi:hypothetical protein